jgi:hypothetical protein
LENIIDLNIFNPLLYEGFNMPSKIICFLK